VIRGSEWLLDVSRAVLTDRQQSIRKADTLLATNAIEALTNRDRNGSCHALSGELCQLLHESVRFWILDI
jgi:hypothetical protein